MNEIIEMARQAGFSETEGLFRTLYICAPSDIESFAKLVADAAAAKEREACAKVADEWVRAYQPPSQVIAEAIRARSLPRGDQ
jgi:hypothetical protein